MSASVAPVASVPRADIRIVEPDGVARIVSCRGGGAAAIVLKDGLTLVLDVAVLRTAVAVAESRR